MTTWSARALDVAFVMAWTCAALAILAAGLDWRPLTVAAALLGIAAGFTALPGIWRGETVWWLRRRAKR